jgi:uncharacterized glyoxalase superfamily protein PhnB
MDGAQSISPVLRYRDPLAAATWLCQAFGFEQRDVAREPSGGLSHILLSLGNISVLVCPAEADHILDDFMVQPEDIGGASTQICYLAIEDIDAVFASAKSAGAKIEFELQDDGDGGRGFMCRDPEGHVWSVGTRAHGANRGYNRKRGSVASVLMLAVMALLSGGGWFLYDAHKRGVAWMDVALASKSDKVSEAARTAMAEQVELRSAAEAAAKEAADALKQERAFRASLDEALTRTRAELSEVLGAKQEVELAVAEAGKLTRAAEQKAKDSALALAQQTARAEAVERKLAALEERKEQLETRVSAGQDARARLEQRIKAIQSELEGLRRASQAAQDQLTEAKAQAQTRVKALSAAANEQLAAAQLKNDQLQTELRDEQVSRLKAEEKSKLTEQELAKQRQAVRVLQGQLEEAKAASVGAVEAAAREENLALSPEPIATASNPEPVTPEQRNASAASAVKPTLSPSSSCVMAVQGKIASRHKGPSTWDAASLTRLCQGAESSVEPARCYERLMSGTVKWGSGSVWVTSNALALCGGTRSASKTIDCFVRRIAGRQNWRTSIARCRVR